MKLSKVKRIVLNYERLCITRADTGIDVRTWIGVDQAMYPVHELVVTPALMARIWELSEKQIHTLHISDEFSENNEAVLLRAGELEQMPALGEAENGEPNLERVCQMDNQIILMNKRTGKALCFSADLLAPVEGGRIQFFAEDNRKEIAVYSDGILEAAIYADDWRGSDYMMDRFGKIAKIWENSRE